MEGESMRMNICELCSSISETYKDNAKKVVLINTSDVYDGKCTNHTFVDNKNLKGQFKKTFRPNDILYSEIRPANRRFAYIDFDTKDYIASTKLMVIRANKGVNPKYLYQILRNNTTINTLQMLAESRSGTFPQITFSELSNIEIDIPSEENQDLIVTILSSLDSKIETNNKLNEKLEEMAQAIFKSWFVDFEPFKDKPFHETELGMIPEGWEVVSLDELTSKFGTGLNPRKNFVLGNGSNYYVTIKNMNNNRIYLDDKCDKVDDEALLKINARSKLKKGDLLFSGIGTIGRVAMVNEEPKNWNTSESVFNMHPSELCTSEFLYVLLLSDVFQKFVKMNALGAVQQGIRMASLKSYTIAIPKKKVMLSFCSIIKPIVDYIQSNNKENDHLASLRDTLLPRLMSGELIV